MEGTIMRMAVLEEASLWDCIRALVGHLFRLHGAASCGRLG